MSLYGQNFLPESEGCPQLPTAMGTLPIAFTIKSKFPPTYEYTFTFHHLLPAHHTKFISTTHVHDATSPWNAFPLLLNTLQVSLYGAFPGSHCYYPVRSQALMHSSTTLILTFDNYMTDFPHFTINTLHKRVMFYVLSTH